MTTKKSRTVGNAGGLPGRRRSHRDRVRRIGSRPPCPRGTTPWAGAGEPGHQQIYIANFTAKQM